MGVNTRMDILKESVKDNLSKVINELHEMMDEDTWGYDEYNEDYIKQLANIQINIRIQKARL